MKMSPGLRVYINPIEKAKLDNWIDLATGEISGFGTIEERADGFEITEVFLVKQVCTGSTTEIDEADIAVWLGEIGDKNNKLRLWWHSHAHMGVFWSGTDEATQKLIDPPDYLISLVMNKKGEFLIRIQLKRVPKLVFDEVPLIVLNPKYDNLRAECEKEVKEKVSTKTYSYAGGYGGGYCGYKGPTSRFDGADDYFDYGYGEGACASHVRTAVGGSVQPDVAKRGGGSSDLGFSRTPTNGEAGKAKSDGNLSSAYTEDGEVNETEVVALYEMDKITLDQAKKLLKTVKTLSA